MRGRYWLGEANTRECSSAKQQYRIHIPLSFINWLLLILFSAVPCFGSNTRTFDTALYAITLDSSCSLVGLHWKDPDLDVIQESRLKKNFHILLPESEYEKPDGLAIHDPVQQRGLY